MSENEKYYFETYKQCKEVTESECYIGGHNCGTALIAGSGMLNPMSLLITIACVQRKIDKRPAAVKPGTIRSQAASGDFPFC